MKGKLRVALLALGLSLAVSPIMAESKPARVEHATVNGMKILLQKNDSELAEVSLLLKSGSGMDPEGKQGTALIMNSLVQLKLSGSNEEFGEFEVNTYPDYTMITVSTTAADLKLVLSEIKDLLTSPLYYYDIITDLIEVYSTDLMALPTINRALLKVNQLLYGPTHPYGEELTAKSVKAIRGADVYRWYRKTYQPGNAILSISGGSKMSVGEIQKFFAPMLSETVDHRLLINPVVPEKNKTANFEDPNGRITTLCMGYPAPRIEDPEYPAFRVLVYYLENFQNYFEELRVKEGLMYAGFVYYSYLENPKAPCAVFMTMTDRETIGRVEDKTVQLLQRIATNGIEQKQIDQVVKTMKADSKNRALAGTGVAGRNALGEYLQTRLLDDPTFLTLVEKVKSDDIKAAAAKYLKKYVRVAFIPEKQADNLYQ